VSQQSLICFAADGDTGLFRVFKAALDAHIPLFDFGFFCLQPREKT
jgi:hypothetical protein